MPKIRTTTLQKRKDDGQKISVLTAYDYPTAKLIDAAGIDAILVGDSCANVMGLPDTLGVTMDDMLHHVKMVTRGTKDALVIADMPFMSYQINPEEALRNAGRFVAEAKAEAVKLEGPASLFGEAIQKILNAGIPVMGHIGFTPQSVNKIGGYKVQGRTEDARESLIQEALALEDIGCFAIVLELVQADVAAEITSKLQVPTIGIGSGVGCDGQVQIVTDILGLSGPYKHSKTYVDLAELMGAAFSEYDREVKQAKFPAKEHEHK